MKGKPIVTKLSKGFVLYSKAEDRALQGFASRNPWRVKICMLVFVVVCSSFIAPLNQPDQLVQKLEEYLAYYTPEKVYLHTDKPYYAAGDTIWFTAYLTHGISHMATAPSKIVYVELINEEKEVLARRDIGINHGTGNGEFALADTLVGGNYLLRGYTSFMRNFDQRYFFHKGLTIAGTGASDSTMAMVDPEISSKRQDSVSYKVADLLEVKFFPEGGDLVEGLWSTVGIKIVGPNGQGLQATGEVVNSKSEKVADLQTGPLGMGKFRFFPEAGESYTTKITLGSQTIEKPFPKAKKEGYVLNVSNLSNENIAVKVEGNLSLKGGYLLAHVRGHVFLTLEADDNKLEALVPKKDLPEGIATFTWFDRQDRPQCERLVFIDHVDNEPQITIGGLNSNYKKREKVSIDVSALAKDTAILSVAVTDKGKVYHEGGEENIKSYLLLNADLRGEIENPGYYFDTNKKSRLQDLDNLLLTQGWRRFTWPDILENKKPEVNFLAEPAGFSIAGQVVDFYNESKPKECLITLTAASKNGDLIKEEMMTDSLGYFVFTSLDLSDTSNIILQTPNEKKLARKGGKQKTFEEGEVNLSTKILLTEFESPTIKFQFREKDSIEAEKFFEDYLSEMRKVRAVNAAFSFGQDVEVLDEIEVRDFRFRPRSRFDRPGMQYNRPTTRIDADSLSRILMPMSPLEFVAMGKVNGVRVTGSGSATGLTSRNGAPKYYLNGMQIYPDDLWILNGVPAANVDFIDILRGPEAASYQALFVVLIYTKTAESIQAFYVPKGVEGFIHPGNYPSREFYTPDYSAKKDSHARTDVRPTLYWKGGLKTTNGTPANLEFYTSDVASVFEIRIEGITEDGRPFVKREEFVVN